MVMTSRVIFQRHPFHVQGRTKYLHVVWGIEKYRWVDGLSYFKRLSLCAGFRSGGGVLSLKRNTDLYRNRYVRQDEWPIDMPFQSRTGPTSARCRQHRAMTVYIWSIMPCLRGVDKSYALCDIQLLATPFEQSFKTIDNFINTQCIR